MYQHPAVADAVLVPQKDPRLGEIPVAIIMPKAGSSVSEKEITDFLGERLARFKVPRKVYIVKQMPRSPVGKILKRELVKMLTSGQIS
jgi:acyl-CoA synthetase (AMP-forming)/AMP-acid ligase II